MPGRAIFAMRVRSQRRAPSFAVRWCQTAITSNGATSMGVLKSLSRLSWLRTSRDGMNEGLARIERRHSVRYSVPSFLIVPELFQAADSGLKMK